ncbi:hypothetical protein [Jeongeupia naejangsanensis]|uniref:Uncharacterized protein n=1 Tax=Jeongeupia naejangsanensis TaxID=613195 RepID=A0ABS2BLD9_9NEIS|nr:hypothetical protein [Jeongeupia naejangsanensis]MBM3116416.1 hypothetical protein [Jeongeupia naejangsanensis]
MPEKMHDLLDVQLRNQRIAIKVFKWFGWFMIVIGVPFLIFPPVALGCFIVGSLAIWASKRFSELAEAANAAMHEHVDQQQKF